MAILGLFTFMTAWTDYLWPLIVLGPTNPTLQTALSQLQSGYYIDYSIVLTGAVLATIPLLVLFVVAGKQLISGIMHRSGEGLMTRTTPRPTDTGRPDFIWGSATAAAQIEGAAHEDGKQDSIWDASPGSPAPSPAATPPSAPSTTTTGCPTTSRS